MFRRIKNDIRVVFERDPAARTVWEVFFCYPGLHAILIYRLAHWLWHHGLKFPARLLSFLARFLTGIEIHPGARLGEGFFIDHGMGVVIGETAEVGENVTLYHGVTLGGTSWRTGKRHPTLEDNVVVGAGAKILGPITVGEGARVGSNAVVVKDVPPQTTVVGVPGRVAMGMGGAAGVDRDHPLFAAYGQVEVMPDPVARAVTCAIEQLHQLDRRMQALEQRLADEEPDAELSSDDPGVREEKSESCSLGDAA